MGGWKIPLNLIDFFYFEVRYFYFHLYKTNIYLEYLFSLCWMEFFPRYNSRRGGGGLGIGDWNKNVLAGKIFKNYSARETSIRHQRVIILYLNYIKHCWQIASFYWSFHSKVGFRKPFSSSNISGTLSKNKMKLIQVIDQKKIFK